nr:MAG: hypothetical protein 2 [Tombusviridae sp.]
MQQRMFTFTSEIGKIAIQTGKASPLTDDSFVAYYGGAKRLIYERAAKSLKTDYFGVRDTHVKLFTKDEYRKPGGAPRAIQPRSPRYNVCLGRYIKHIEHNVYNAIDQVYDPSKQHKTVAKGMNMITRGQTIAAMWGSFNNPIAIGLDASRFDQHININLLKHEHRIIQMFAASRCSDLPNLSTLLKAQLRNKGSYRGPDGTIKYEVNGCRMSGDMNTSLGNVIVMCSLMFSYIEHVGLRGKVKLLNDGDDCVIVLDRKNKSAFVTGLEKWFLEMGITMKFEGEFTQLEHIQFCQSQPVFSEIHGYQLVPRPVKRLYSDLISSKNLSNPYLFKNQVGAVAGCGLACSSGIPIFQAFYLWLGSGASPWIPEMGDAYYKYRQELVDGMEFRKREPSIRERISFYFAYGLTPDQQMIVETYYNELKSPHYSTPVEDPPTLLHLVQKVLVPPEQAHRNMRR